MKITDITSQTIKDISNSELSNLHYRAHQLYKNAEKKNDKSQKEFYSLKHTILVKEMNMRNLKHNSPLSTPLYKIKENVDDVNSGLTNNYNIIPEKPFVDEKTFSEDGMEASMSGVSTSFGINPVESFPTEKDVVNESINSWKSKPLNEITASIFTYIMLARMAYSLGKTAYNAVMKKAAKCNKWPPELKSECKLKYKIQANQAKIVKIQLSMAKCHRTNNPEKCKEKLQNKIDNIKETIKILES